MYGHQEGLPCVMGRQTLKTTKTSGYIAKELSPSVDRYEQLPEDP